MGANNYTQSLIKKSQLMLTLCADPTIWNSAFNLVSNKKTRVSDVAAWCMCDPVISMELISRANAVITSGFTGLSSVEEAITRLGYDKVKDILYGIVRRPQLKTMELRRKFASIRRMAYQQGMIAKFFAEELAKSSIDKSQTVGTFMLLGEMLAIASFKDDYLRIAKECNNVRSKINYVFIKEYKFDFELATRKYLRFNYIPDSIVDIIERTSDLPKEDVLVRTICFSASEMIEAFYAGRFLKLSPDNALPPKSYIRLLPMSLDVYRRIYAKATFFFEKEKKEIREHEVVDGDENTNPDTNSNPNANVNVGVNVESRSDLDLDDEFDEDFDII